MFAALALCILLGACASPAPNGAPSFALVSSQKDKMSEYYVPAGDPIKAEDCASTILYIVTWGVQGHSDEALLAKVLDKYKADALMDTKFTHTGFFIPILFSNFCTSVTGTPFKLKG